MEPAETRRQKEHSIHAAEPVCIMNRNQPAVRAADNAKRSQRMVHDVLSQPVDQAGGRHVQKIRGSRVEVDGQKSHLRKLVQFLPEINGLG